MRFAAAAPPSALAYAYGFPRLQLGKALRLRLHAGFPPLVLSPHPVLRSFALIARRSCPGRVYRAHCGFSFIAKLYRGRQHFAPLGLRALVKSRPTFAEIEPRLYGFGAF
jgi:hypothetical protein